PLIRRQTSEMNSTQKTILVLGAGAWGTALAIHLTRRHHAVRLWGKALEQITTMQRTRMNMRYLPGKRLPDTLVCTADLNTAFYDAIDTVLVAVPSSSL